MALVVSVQRGRLKVAFGALQILLGAFLIISDVSSCAIHRIEHRLVISTGAFSGIYVGAFYLLTGSFNLAAHPRPPGELRRNQEKCVCITLLILNISSIVFGACMVFIFTMVFINVTNYRFAVEECTWDSVKVYLSGTTVKEQFHDFWHMGASLGLHALASIVNLAQLVITGCKTCPSNCRTENARSPATWINRSFVTERPAEITKAGDPGFVYPDIVYSPSLPPQLEPVYTVPLDGDGAGKRPLYHMLEKPVFTFAGFSGLKK